MRIEKQSADTSMLGVRCGIKYQSKDATKLISSSLSYTASNAK